MNLTEVKMTSVTTPKPKVWSCVACTFENLESNVTSCSICGKKNPEAKISWECRKCTFQNSGDKTVCDICCCSKGWQCPKCPFWNMNNNAFKCEACGHSMISQEELIASAFMAAQQYVPTYPESDHVEEEEEDAEEAVGFEMLPTEYLQGGYSKLD